MLKTATAISLALAYVMLLFTGAYAGDGRIEKEITREILAAVPWSGSDVSVDDIEVYGYDPAAVRFDTVKVLLPKQASYIGKLTVSVSLLSKGREVKTVMASATVRAFKEIVVAVNPVRMGQKIEKDDLRLQRMEARDMFGALDSIDEAAGMIAKRPITAGSVVKKDYIKPETVIRRGDRVSVLISNDRMKIKTAATAVEDGYNDKTITVRTPSGKEVSGKVVGPGEILVEF
ncbi:MAG: flagellar basal body P-ring formation protein FlgA [Deltaproteobacteria bacterium]|nr:flagellar basal body P-ring formation protein FlgA [Deltaproteobacteria bacterium]